MERRGCWYHRRSRSLLFSVHPLSVTAEFRHYLICHSSQTCDKKQTNAHWWDTTMQFWILLFSLFGNQCFTLFYSRLRNTWLCVFVCVCVALTAEVFDPISEVGIPADFLTLREKQRYLSNVQRRRRQLRKIRSDMLPFTIYQRFLDASAAECLFVGFLFIHLFSFFVSYCCRTKTLPVDGGRCMSATKHNIK